MSTLLVTETPSVVAVADSVPKRLSRRALMKAAAIVPVLAAGRRAWADPTTKNLLDVMRVAPMDPDDVKYVREQSKLAYPDVDEDRVELVWRVLWSHFHLGLGGFDWQGEADGKSLAKHGFDTPKNGATMKTGAIIAKNVRDGNFDPLGNHYQTNVCAYILGHKAALLACDSPAKKLTPQLYRDARKATEDEMSKKLACVPSRGPGNPSDLSLGYGC